MFKKAAAVLTAVCCTATCFTQTWAEPAAEIDDGDVVVLFTNDVHNAYEQSEGTIGYAALAAYKKQLEAAGKSVILVDCGDAIQGSTIGTLSDGKYITEIMNECGYDIAIPGNHEFDYGLDNLFEIADMADFEYVSCNFTDKDGNAVFAPYKMISTNGIDMAFVGICTPETMTKSDPIYFMDENGNYTYSFCGDSTGKALYDAVQLTVDKAKADGADFVIAVGHTGVDSQSAPWTSYDIIANTTGIDAYLDGHSHSELLDNLENKDKNGKDFVALAQTGSNFANLGQLNIAVSEEGVENYFAALIPASELTEQDSDMLTFIDGINKNFEELVNKVVAHSDVDLIANDPATEDRIVRTQETNLGDLCADAYLAMSGDADIAFVNGGGVRANINKGDITYGNIISVHPFGNSICEIEVTGQQVLDALEHASASAGESPSGGFLQVAGITYEIDTTIPSSVVVDENKMFVKVDGEYRVKNVVVGGEPLDLTKTYKLASHNYMLKNQGDGFTMFKGAPIIKDEVMIDNEALINYITDVLGGNIAADSVYADTYGNGRIKVIVEKKDATETEDGYIKYLKGYDTVTEVIEATGVTPDVDNTDNSDESDTPITSEPDSDGEDVDDSPITTEPGAESGEAQQTPIITNPGSGSADADNTDTGVQEGFTAAVVSAAALAVAAVLLKKRK